MNFDANFLLASLVVSSIGFVLFVYGKRMRRVPHLAVGVILLVYPYFLSSIPWLFAIALLLLLALWLAVRQGY